MKLFVYKAYDADGAKIDGDIEALNIEAAQKALSQQGYMVVSVVENQLRSIESGFLARKYINSEELEFLTSELSLLLNSGVTIDRSLAVILRNSSSAPQGRLIKSLHDAVRRGDSLSDAMKAERETFNPLYVNLVMLGESSGTLPSVFNRLAQDIKFQSELKSKVIQALTYPLVIFGVCILCIVFVFNYIVPQMSGLFEGLPEIPVYTAILLKLSSWMITYQWFLLLGIVLLAFAVALLIRNPAGARYLDETLLKLPGLQHIFILLERIRFNTAIAMMLDAGVLIDRCLEMSIGSVKNQSLRQGLVVAKERVKKGESLSTALSASPLYSDFSLSLIEVGEESGKLPPVFNEISSRSRREFESWVDRMTSLLEPVLIIVMGGVVGGVVVTMLLSIVSVNDIGV